MQPGIILLREGTDTSQGKAQLISNINACAVIVDTVKSTLGPRGMDKLMYTEGNRASTVVSNDGATIMKQLDIVHPAAQTLVEVAKSQDAEVGDGTTSVVVLAGELLKESKNFVNDGVHPQVIIKGFRAACRLALERVRALAVGVEKGDATEARKLYEACASTALCSKLLANSRVFFARMVVDAVMTLDDDLSLDLIAIKKEPGATLEDSRLVPGVAFKKTFSYAGFEQQPKSFKNARIAVLNLELELKAEKDNAEMRVEGVEEYNKVVDAEWKIIYDKLEKLHKCGANVILSRLAIGDLATQFFADRGVFCAGRVAQDDLTRVCQATGAAVQTSINDLSEDVLGHCDAFEEQQVGANRYNVFTGCKETHTATILLRGGGEHFNDEAERSIHDAIMVVRRARKHPEIVAGGGAIEMEVSKDLRLHARSIQGKQQAIINAYAKALEVIPRQVAMNAGLEATDLLNKLRQKHAGPDGTWFGIDIENDSICNTMDAFVWEPALVKINSITSATEAACLILSVDETVKNPKSQASMADNTPAPGGGRGRGPRRR